AQASVVALIVVTLEAAVTRRVAVVVVEVLEGCRRDLGQAPGEALEVAAASQVGVDDSQDRLEGRRSGARLEGPGPLEDHLEVAGREGEESLGAGEEGIAQGPGPGIQPILVLGPARPGEKEPKRVDVPLREQGHGCDRLTAAGAVRAV